MRQNMQWMVEKIIDAAHTFDCDDVLCESPEQVVLLLFSSLVLFHNEIYFGNKCCGL